MLFFQFQEDFDIHKMNNVDFLFSLSNEQKIFLKEGEGENEESWISFVRSINWRHMVKIKKQYLGT